MINPRPLIHGWGGPGDNRGLGVQAAVELGVKEQICVVLEGSSFWQVHSPVPM